MDFAYRSRKRGRDDGDDDLAVRIAGVPADKKQRQFAQPHQPLPAWLQVNQDLRPPMQRAHTLPFRLDHPAPAPPPPIFEQPEAISPTDTSSANSPASFMSLPAPLDLADEDMALDHHIAIVGSASPPSPYYTFLRPDKLNSPGLDQLSGRIPTPIHSSFDLANPPHPPPPRSRTNLPYLSASAHNPVLPAYIMRASKPLRADDYRMPSPIVEDSMETSDLLPSRQLSRLSVSQDSMDVDDDDGAVWLHPSSQNEYNDIPWDTNNMPPTPTTPGGGRIGRARSGAFSSVNSATSQEKGGRKVVFGFREDCQKCRMRFPGHFAHFV